MTDIAIAAAQFGAGIFIALVVMVAYQRLVGVLISVVKENTAAFTQLVSAVTQSTQHAATLDSKLVDVLRTNTAAMETGAAAMRDMTARIDRLERRDEA